MKTRFSNTNGKDVGIIKQVKGLLGWRDVEYMNSPVHKLEKEMNKLAVKLAKLDSKRDDLLLVIDAATADIKNSSHAMLGTSDAQLAVVGFKAWLKSFTLTPLTVKPKKTWEPLVMALRSSGSVGVASKRVTVTTQALTTSSIQPAKYSKPSGKQKNSQS